MIRLLLLAFSLASLARAAPEPILCRVEVTSHPTTLGRQVSIQVRPDCPPGGVARVRLASQLGGSLPDNPPGVYTLRPGQKLRRTVLRWWWVEWLSASGRPYRVPER